MKIAVEEVERIARLANLRFDGDELERLRGHLDQILAYIDKLNELDLSGVEPPAGGAAGEAPPLREDRPQACLTTDEALGNAPESGRGHFKVPRVLG